MEKSRKSTKKTTKKTGAKPENSNQDLENFIEIKESQNKVLGKLIEKLENKKKK